MLVLLQIYYALLINIAPERNNVKNQLAALHSVRWCEISAARILSSHTPKHLQDQVTGIASMDNFVNAVCIPETILIERKVLCIARHPLEMPATYVVLKE